MIKMVQLNLDKNTVDAVPKFVPAILANMTRDKEYVRSCEPLYIVAIQGLALNRGYVRDAQVPPIPLVGVSFTRDKEHVHIGFGREGGIMKLYVV